MGAREHRSRATESSRNFSPDGAEIAFLRDVLSGAPHLLVVNVDGTRQLELLSDTGPFDLLPDPVWSPDGRRIAFGRDIVGVEGAEHDVTGALVDSSPSWSPDALHIVYGLGNTLVVANSAGAAERAMPLTHEGEALSPWAPTWSPDGEWIAFAHVSSRHDRLDVYAVTPDGTCLRHITHGGTESTQGTLGTRLTWLPEN